MATDTDPMAAMMRRIKQLEHENDALRSEKYGDVRPTYGNGIGTFAANASELPDGWKVIDMESMEWQGYGPGYKIMVAKHRASREDVIKLVWLVHNSKAQVVSDKQQAFTEAQTREKGQLLETLADVAIALGWKGARSKQRRGRFVEYHLPPGCDMLEAIETLKEEVEMD